MRKDNCVVLWIEPKDLDEYGQKYWNRGTPNSVFLRAHMKEDVAKLARQANVVLFKNEGDYIVVKSRY